MLRNVRAPKRDGQTSRQQGGSNPPKKQQRGPKASRQTNPPKKQQGGSDHKFKPDGQTPRLDRSSAVPVPAGGVEVGADALSRQTNPPKKQQGGSNHKFKPEEVLQLIWALSVREMNQRAGRERWFQDKVAQVRAQGGDLSHRPRRKAKFIISADGNFFLNICGPRRMQIWEELKSEFYGEPPCAAVEIETRAVASSFSKDGKTSEAAELRGQLDGKTLKATACRGQLDGKTSNVEDEVDSDSKRRRSSTEEPVVVRAHPGPSPDEVSHVGIDAVRRFPEWGCTCGTANNWAWRLTCRKCGRHAPRSLSASASSRGTAQHVKSRRNKRSASTLMPTPSDSNSSWLMNPANRGKKSYAQAASKN